MAWFKYVAFVGAAALLFALSPEADNFSFIARSIGTFAFLWGSCYFLLKENEVLYGTMCIIMAVAVQPYYLISYSIGMWMIVDIISIVFLLLAGGITYKIEKHKAYNKKKLEAEMEFYRKNEERVRNLQMDQELKNKSKGN